MRKPILPIITLALMLAGFSISTPTHAQENVTWFWATTPDGLVAYTLDGQINQVLADSTLNEAPLQGTRLSSDTALLYDEASRTVYFASSDTVASVSLDEQFDVFSVVEYRPSYVLFTGARLFPAAGILNVETMQIAPLTGYVYPILDPFVFVDDATLRYFSYSDSTAARDTPSTLWERDLVTGAETALLELDYAAIRVFHSQDGQQWWLAGPPDRTTHQYESIATYGEVNPATTAIMQQLGSQIRFDQIVTLDFMCEVACPITITPLAGGETRSYTLPQSSLSSLQILARLDDGTLLVYEYSQAELYRLDPIGGLTDLGQTSSLYLGRQALLSKDGHWGITLGQPDDTDASTLTYRLWNMTTGQLVYEAPLDHFVTATFAQDTVLILNGRYFSLYYADTRYDLSAYESYFFQPLEKGHVLYQSTPNQAITQGVYLYDAADDTLTLVLPEGRGIPLQELISPN
ncbi:MAG: hypothetical protein HY862_06960 [Chloroflexi bacterium]|nr:hypothetical protein [Chloroflexota bacterium]